MVSIPSKFPPKCQECAKLKGPILNRKCNFCRELELCESVLCDLNRCVQSSADFDCHAFQPVLKLAKASGNEAPDLSGGLGQRSRRESLLKLLHSDKIKYDTALALQKLDRDPAGVFVSLKYHLAWNVVQRRPVFKPSDHYLDLFHDAFSKCGDLVAGVASLIWLAPDHIHVYIESDGEKSVETIVHGLKQFSRSVVAGEFLDLAQQIGHGMEIWDKAYLSETVG
jgi:REP element-mobilizing transposase RayT